MKKHLRHLGVTILFSLWGNLLFGATQTYYIALGNLINCTTNCGTGSYYGSAGQGFTWNDVIPGGNVVSAVTIQFNVGVECSPAVRSTSLNTVAQGNISTASWCNCALTTAVHTISASPSNYTMGGVNTFVVNGGGTFGFCPDASLSNNYAIVTVTYAPACAVTITSQPSNASACSGTSTNFSITATGATSYQWEYFNGATWNNVVNGTPTNAIYTNPTTPTLSVGGTMAAGSYQYRCNAINTCTTTSNTATRTVTSIPACNALSSPANGATGQCSGGVTLSWGSSSGATGYKLYFGTDAAATNIINGTNLGVVFSYATGVLSQNTTYYWKIVPINSCGDATGCTIRSFATATPCYCTAQSCCGGGIDGFMVNYDYISYVSIGSISNSTGFNGYGNYTAQSTNVIIGTGYALTVQLPGYQWNYTSAYVDWNQDGDFQDASETIWSNQYSTWNFSGTVTPPVGAAVGNTRLRIMQWDDNEGWSPSPAGCGEVLYGDVEDYTLTVCNTSITSQPTASTICMGGSANFSLTASNAISYQWQRFTGAVWVNVANGTPTGAVYTNATTAAMTVSGVSVPGNTTYRCNVTGSGCTTTSNSVILTVGPNYTNDGCGLNMYISNFTTTLGSTNINNTTGCSTFASGNYADYTAQAVTVTPGSSFNISMTQPCTYSMGFRIWIDYNNDGDFADAGEDVWNSGAIGCSFSGSIAVPSGTSAGTKRMRVRNNYNAIPASNAYCSTLSYGETEDYSLIVFNPPYRATFTAMNTGAATWCAGETRNVTVTVTNSGTSTWTDAAPDINIGCKWNAEADYFVRVNAGGLAPSASATYTLSMTAPSAGANNLTFNIVKEGDCWFSANSGNCGPGNSVYTSAGITISCCTPSSPVSVVGTSSGSTTANLSWAAGAGISSPTVTYNWYVGTNSGGNCPVSGTANFSYTGSVQTWVVPAGVTSINITTRGAQGGNGGPSSGSGAGASGAVLTSTNIAVTPGHTLNILVGAQGAAGGTYGGGGGGATYVWNATTSTLLSVAGGGGGYGYSTDATPAAGQTNTGMLNTANQATGSGTSGTGGNGGSGGTNGAWTGGGGAGWISNGAAGNGSSSGGGLTPGNGGSGGAAGPTYGAAGGYGGGGGGNVAGGGGGGYNGGGGGGVSMYSGGSGGGSYVISGTPTTSFNSGNGSASITYSSAAAVASGSTTGTTASATGLTCGTTYYLSVMATTSCNGSSSACVTSTAFVCPCVTISTSAVSGSPFCAGDAVSVPFTSTGTLGGGNVFTAQLSNSSGSFASPTSIGTLASTSNNGTISATIPAGASGGSGYRIRVVSSNPVATGTDNGSNLSISAQPTSSNSSAQTICPSGTATLAGNNPSVGSGVWSVVSGPSTNSSQFTSTTVYNTTFTPASGAGNYVTRWTVSNSPCTAATADATITVAPWLPVSVSIAASPSGAICSGTSVVFTATPTNGGAGPAYQWKKNAVNVGTNSNTYTDAGLVNGDVITCVLTSNATCPTGNPATSNSLNMTVNPLPSTAVTVSPASTTQCGGTVLLTASGGAGGTIYWHNTTSNGTSTASTTNPQTVSSSGTYYFRARTAAGCWGADGSAVVTINTIPSNVTVSGGGTFCGSATLTASGGGGGTIYWQGTTSGGTSTATPSSSQSVSSSGTYYFRSLSGAGCWGNEGSATVTINPVPTAVTVSGGGTFCLSSSTTLTASGGVGGTMYWQNTTSGGTSTTDPSTSEVINFISGTYYFRARSAAGCWSTEGSATVTFDVAPVQGSVSNAGPIDFCSASGDWSTDPISLAGTTGTVWWQFGSSNGTWSGDWVSGISPAYTVFPKKVSVSDGNADRVRWYVKNGVCPPTSYSAPILLRNHYNEAPSGLSSNINNICAGTPGTLTATFPTATNILGTVEFATTCAGTPFATVAGNGTTSVATAFTAPSSTTTYYARYNPGTGSGCSPTSCVSTVVTILAPAPATPGVISGTVAHCPNVTGKLYSISAVTNATSYAWTVPAGWTITAGQGTTVITVTVGNFGQNGNITVTASNTCGTSSAATLAVNTNGCLPTPTQLSFPTNANAYVTITNGASLVIGNSATDAIINSGNSGGFKRWIISEGQNNTVQWNSIPVANYVIPFGYSTTDYIPFTFNKTAGAASNLTVSTWSTPSNNTPWCTATNVAAVTNMSSQIVVGDASVQSVIDRWWSISTTATADMVFSYRGAENTTTWAPTGVFKAQHWNGTTWDPSVGTGAGVLSGIGTVSVTGASTFSPWVLSSSDAPLPVQWLDVSAECNNGDITVKWSTATEQNADYFTVERSTDGLNYEPLSHVLASGNSNTIKHYSYSDTSPLPGTAFYRIRETDFNASFMFSNVMITNECTDDDISIFGNGFGVSVIINAEQDGEYYINIFNVLGEPVAREQVKVVAGTNHYKLMPTTISSAIYVVKVQNGSNIVTKRIFIRSTE